MSHLTFDQLPEAISVLLEKVSNIEMKLQSSAPAEQNADKWFNLVELCAYLTDKPAKPTVYAYVSAGTIPSHKKGKKLFFLKSEIDNWLRSGRRKTLSELKDETRIIRPGKGGRS